MKVDNILISFNLISSQKLNLKMRFLKIKFTTLLRQLKLQKQRNKITKESLDLEESRKI